MISGQFWGCSFTAGPSGDIFESCFYPIPKPFPELDTQIRVYDSFALYLIMSTEILSVRYGFHETRLYLEFYPDAYNKMFVSEQRRLSQSGCKFILLPD